MEETTPRATSSPFRQFKNTFNNTRRRLAERALQAAGIHGTSDDAEFEDAVRRFDELCEQLRAVELTMQEYLASLGTMIEVQHRLASTIDTTFIGQPFASVSNKYAHANRSLLSDYALLKQVYLNHVLHPTNELLQCVPAINELLEQRGAVKLDYDSYDRRLNAERAKDPYSAATQKLAAKKQNTEAKLAEITQRIREHFDALQEQRKTMLVSELSALVGVQHAFSSQQAAMLASLLPSVPHAAVSMCALAHARDERG